ncbi:hypothetical protein [Streptomyces sp. A244]|uniref:hypothetical protein n=1 Tax=Streptomyces sp. A244 TaxID=2137016 RepID=UPI0035C23AA0
MDDVGDPPRPVRVLRQGELAAIVSDAPEDLRPSGVICRPTSECWTQPGKVAWAQRGQPDGRDRAGT